MIDLSIIIVTYNSERQIAHLLDSIARSKDKLTKEVIIIDNASQDKSAQIALKHKSAPTVIQSPTNVGFAKSVNQGISISTGRYLLLLNPDTELVGNCLTTLVEFASKTPLGAVVPRLLNPDGQPQPSVAKFPTITNAIRHNFFGCKTCFGKYLPTSRTDPEVVDVAVMAAFLLPHPVIDRIGSLDERFFLYYEDIEFCRRLKQAGLPIYYLATAKVKHVHGASGKFTQHLKSPLLKSARIYYGPLYSWLLNLTLWVGHKWQVVLRRKRFRD